MRKLRVLYTEQRQRASMPDQNGYFGQFGDKDVAQVADYLESKNISNEDVSMRAPHSLMIAENEK